MTLMRYLGAVYRCEVIDGKVRVLKIEEEDEELPLWLTGDLDNDINACIIENLDPNSIPWDELDLLSEQNNKKD
jgi:hypothetical protein